MAFTNLTNRADYTGNGSTATYAFGYRIIADADLLITLRHPTTGAETTLVLTTDYTVVGAGEPTGSIVLVNASQAWLTGGFLTTGWAITIRRVLALTQPASFRNGGTGFRASHEDGLDRLVMIAQQKQDEVDRALKLPETVSQSVVDPELPVPAAGKLLAVNAGGTAFEYVEPATIGAFLFPAGTGILVKDAALNAIVRSIAAGTGISVGNGSGVSGDPTVSLAIPDLYVTPAMLASAAIAPVFNARLTLVTATPVTVTDQLAKGTVYLSPYKGNRVALYDGTSWRMIALTEKSIAVSATINQMFDLFLWSNAGVPTLEAVAWTSDTVRATALELKDGVLVKSGDNTRRYVGSYRTTGVANQTEDSLAKRYLWNYYNRVERPMLAADGTASWNYTTDTWRQANADTANQLDFIIGVSEEPVSATAVSLASNTGADKRMQVGIGMDETTATDAQINGFSESTADHVEEFSAIYQGFPGIGRHYLAWLEKSEASGTTTWRGATSEDANAGIVGSLRG